MALKLTFAVFAALERVQYRWFDFNGCSIRYMSLVSLAHNPTL